MTPDSSVLVAAFATWHDRHRDASASLRGVRDVVAHAELEAYSVLTRVPAPFRMAPEVIAAFMRERCPGRRLALPGAARRSLVSRLAAQAIAGGSVYDALIAATAAEHGVGLLTADGRARGTYERLGVAYELI